MSNIRGLGSLRKEEGSGSDSEGEGPNRRQGFFVGGSEHSGQQVLGPPGRGRNTDEVAERLFAAARAAGAETVDPSVERTRRAAQRGVRLDGAQAAGAESGSEGEGEAEHEVRLIMWQNGFSIDDGPLRTFEEPNSREFLESIMQGQIPMELRRQYPNHRIDLRMERKAEEYKAPKAKPFGGSGVRLGAVVPDVVVASSSATATSAPVPQENVENLVEKAQTEVGLDSSAPVSQLQIRLPAGNRVLGKFNHSHTVQSVRTFLVAACPELAFSPFQLMTTFPNKVIEDETLSLKDAGLINAVVVVKPVA